MKRAYRDVNFHGATLAIIKNANSIIREYQADGLTLTLRQLYYQFVSRDLLANKQANYDKLGKTINDARLSGYIDWSAIEDRTRGAEIPTTCVDPAEYIDPTRFGFKNDLWRNQKYRPEIWIEKEALAGVFDQLCRPHRLPYLGCRGYTSQSTMHSEAQRLIRYAQADQIPVIIHFGDLDPSGWDMSRDIKDRLTMFMEADDCQFQFVRAALNMDQVREVKPPPNPAKQTDCRFKKFCDEFGDESYELDALDIRYLRRVVDRYVVKYRNARAWNKLLKIEAEQRALLTTASDEWPSVAEHLRESFDIEPEIESSDDEEPDENSDDDESGDDDE
jgi:hypothetical protein